MVSTKCGLKSWIDPMNTTNVVKDRSDQLKFLIVVSTLSRKIVVRRASWKSLSLILRRFAARFLTIKPEFGDSML